MKFKEANRAYETFLYDSLPVVEADLDHKHSEMTRALFPFMRSTFFRWSVLFREICPDVASAPQLLAVGDLHVENFGTWRDGEGRLIWGINDVDEAQDMPYTIDLVRLAASGLLAVKEAGIALSADEICESILEGYGEWLKSGGRAYVLEEEHAWLRDLAMSSLRNPTLFAEKMAKTPDADPPKHVAGLLTGNLPKGAELRRFSRRTAGLGSLGRPRYLALAECQGGGVVREAKAMLPSGWNWSLGNGAAPIRCGEIVEKSIRCADPCLHFIVEGKTATAGWVVRRLAPHCSRVEMADLPHRSEEKRLLRAMGRETANVHLGSKDKVEAVRKDFAGRNGHWLKHAAVAMVEATEKDWAEWRG